MELRIFTEPQQGASHEQLLRVAQQTERCGFDAFFRSDHYLKMGSVDGLPGPSDAWVTLGALARETSRIRLGTLVSPATFRLPGPLAIQVAQIDEMSGGRVELGLGAGWYEAEHAAYGIPFPPVKERFDILEEQLEIISGLWATKLGDTYSFAGEHYRLTDSPALPKPVQQPAPPIIVGGAGKRRTPELAVRYAAEFNVGFRSVADTAEIFERVRATCEAAGRDPSTLVFSTAHVVVVGRNDAEIARRAEAAGQDVANLPNIYGGTPAQVVDKLGEYAELGVSRIYLQVLDLDDLDHLELAASEVAPQLS